MEYYCTEGPLQFAGGGLVAVRPKDQAKGGSDNEKTKNMVFSMRLYHADTPAQIEIRDGNMQGTPLESAL